jgi:hypothetical protein
MPGFPDIEVNGRSDHSPRCRKGGEEDSVRIYFCSFRTKYGNPSGDPESVKVDRLRPYPDRNLRTL